jgi:glycosyltransferase involved in cell wall biosynthesis
LSAAGVFPTKIGEYLAAGLPVVANKGIGDVEEILRGRGSETDGPVGVLVEEFTEEAYRRAVRDLLVLLEDPSIRERCRRVAEEQLDLERIGWPRYRGLYERLAQKI